MSDSASPKPRSPWSVYVPAIAFFALVAVFAVMLTQEGRNTSALPSALIGREAPNTPLPEIPGLKDANGVQVSGLDPSVFDGNITLLNVWGSWCGPCREEHPLLVELGKDDRFQIIGLNQRDKPENAIQFLSSLGNPYDSVGADTNGRASIDWGVYGVPETFLIGPDGVIRFKHTGPLRPESIERDLMPEIELLVVGSQEQ